MGKLLTYRQFVNESVEYSPLDSYRPIAFTIARAFNILFYLEDIANPDLNPREWNLFATKLKRVKDVDDKLEIIRDYMEEKHRELKSFTSSRFDGKTGYYGKIFDVGLLSEKLPDVIDNLIEASNLLTKGLRDQRGYNKDLAERSNLISEAIPKERVNIFESSLPLLEKRTAPYDSELVQLIQLIGSNITSLRGVANSIIKVYPDSEEYTRNVVTAYLDPAQDELNSIINRKESTSTQSLPKQTIKAYKRDGWDIETASDKAAVDLFNDLEALKTKVTIAGEKIRKASNKVTDTLSGKTAASEWIDAANSMLDAIERNILDKVDTEELKRKESSMIPVSDDDSKTSGSTPSGRSPLEDIERLKKIVTGRR